MASGGYGGPVIGIDLGTTYSCVGVWKHDRIEIIPNDQGNRTTPSYVAFTDIERLIGEGAKNQVGMNPTNTVFDAKRLIGRRFSDDIVQDDMKLWPFEVIEGANDTPKILVTYKGYKREFSIEEISSMVLAKMKKVAEEYLGETVRHAVITVPAYFNDYQRQATKDAGAIAGLDVVRIINEPTAAAIAYGLRNMSTLVGKRNVLVFDLGGGTFDVSLLTISQEGTFEVKAVAGDTHLGGEDFDNRMVSYCVQEFKKKWNKDMTRNQRALGRLKLGCEEAKRTLSFSAQASITLETLHEGIDFSMKFTRAKFEELNMDFFKKCITKLETCLNDANMDRRSVHEVILVGGSSRIPKIQSMLRDFFNGKELCKGVSPDEAVAFGAAAMAAELSGHSEKMQRSLVLLEVTPLSLGTEIKGELMSVVIPRNTPIPTRKTKTFVTTVNNQYSMKTTVYQGERTRSSDNHLLGKFTIFGIPPAPKGEAEVEDCFEIDINGILTVTSKVVSTGKSEQLTVTNHSGRLSKEEIKKMMKDAEKFKYEDQEYKRKVEASNALDHYIYVLKNKINEYDTKKKLPAQVLKNMEHAIADTTEWLLVNKGASIDEIEGKKDYLEYMSKLIN